MPSAISNSSQPMNAADGWRDAATAATAEMFMMPPRKMGTDVNRPFIS